MSDMDYNNMEALKRERMLLRHTVTRTINDIEAMNLNNPEHINYEELRIKIDLLHDQSDRLFDISDRITAELCTDQNQTDEALKLEFDVAEGYRATVFRTRARVRKLLEKTEEIADVTRSNLRLPEIKTPKFDGQVKNWLPFWSSFKKIDEDATVSEDVKFEYLLQSMAPDSKPQEIVKIYQQAGSGSYKKAIDELTNMFGKEDYLIDFYIRELYDIIFVQVTGNKAKFSLCDLYTRLKTHINVLENLKVIDVKNSKLLFPLIESALPEEIMKNWNREKKAGDDMYKLMEFIRCEVEGEQRVQLAKKVHSIDSSDFSQHQRPPVPATGECLINDTQRVRTSINSCLFCNGNHESTSCYNAQKLSVEKRRDIVAKERGCFICLKRGHMAKNCNFKFTIKCLVCKRAHNVLLCEQLEGGASDKTKGAKYQSEDGAKATNIEREKINNNNKQNNYKKGKEKEIVGKGKTTETVCAYSESSQDVFMQTMLVKIKFAGKEKLVRVMCDSGSKHSYILTRLVKELGCTKVGNEIALNHCVFGGSSQMAIHNKYVVEISDLNGKITCTVPLLNEKVICSSAPKVLDIKNHPEVVEQGIQLTDIFSENLEIGVLLGADVMANILTGNGKHINNMIAQETLFGWTIMGRCGKSGIYEIEDKENIDTLSLKVVSDLWDLESLGIRDPIEVKSRKTKDLEVMEKMENALKINEKLGRYEAPLPFKEIIVDLNSNREIAEKRLRSTTARLEKIGYFKKYDEVFKDWEKEQIIEEIEDKEEDRFKGHYLPHRPVIKVQSSTPVRPVFDASCKDKNNISINECLETGPNLLEIIPTILIRFRLKKIGISADIRRAFLQIALREEDTEYVKFLWWKDETKSEFKVYKHKRVVFGLTCSPFILNLVIKHHLKMVPEELKATAELLNQAFYVDNCILSLDTEEELREFVDNSDKIMETANFELRQWAYSLNVDGKTISCKKVMNEKQVSILGMNWDCENDLLSCPIQKIKEEPDDVLVTKRKILSVAQKVFDPLGILSPVTLIPKILLQQCWKENLKWDEEAPPKIAKPFRKWLNDLHKLSDCKIPRYYGEDIDEKNSTIHVFCDASDTAYGIVIYLRTETVRGVKIQFLFGKARVAPLRLMSNIPRLELMGALIGTRAAKFVQETLTDYNLKTYFWTDSRITLDWIRRLEKPNREIFVRNRVKEILILSRRDQWNHVEGKDNPADGASRGMTINKFLESKWWNTAPQWLFGDFKEKLENPSNYTDDIEISFAVISTKEAGLIERICSYTKIIKVGAQMIRFLDKCKEKSGKKPKVVRGEKISSEEFHAMEVRLIKLAQEESVIDKITPHLKIVKNRDDILCVKTKLLEGPFTEEFKTPILLSGKHLITHRIVREYHWKNKHVKGETLIALIRERFYICGIRRVIKEVIKKCAICQIYDAKPINIEESPLPKDRITTGKAFQVTGVDLCGPLYLEDGSKCWITLFTCAVYRAIHLELVLSLSTESLEMAFRRFIARRGRISIVYSDNGTNFQGLNNELERVDWSQLEQFCELQRIEWKFIAPKAPWWGGFWERMVRSVKDLLRRNLGKSHLTYEELYTLTCDVESIINARPLTYQSMGEELIPISPSLFIQDLDTSEIPDFDQIGEMHINEQRRYLQNLREGLRMRFRKEYLAQLVHRGKNVKDRQAEVGEVVLIEEEGIKRTFWPVGIIEEILDSKDKKIRSVIVKTTKGRLTRPVQKLYPLELKVSDSFFRDIPIDPSAIRPPSKSKAKSKPKSSSLSLGRDNNSNSTPPARTTRSGRKVNAPPRMNL